MLSGNQKTIAFVLKGYPRLSETFITNEILLLEKLGCRIHIFALRNPGEKKIHENIHRIKAKVTYIPDYFWPDYFLFVSSNFRLWLENPKRYWPAFKYALLRSIRQRSSSTIKRFAQAAILVQKKLSGTQVEYFHAHFSHGPTTVAYFASWLTGFPYSFSAHAKDIYLQDTEFLTKKIWGAKFAVTCTEYNRRHLANIVGEDAPVYRVYHGIDLELFHPRKKTARNGVTKPNILSIGRFVPKKGFPVLLKALKQVKDQGVDFHCDLVGGGEMQDELAALSQELGLQENVTLHGKKSQTELLIFYQKADLFALACEVQKDGDRDGIPNVLVEAMAMKIPVISTRISGIPELITHNESGLLVEQKKPQVMADAIALLLRDRILANRLAEGGLHKIQTDFDNKQNVQLIADFLNTAFTGEEIVKVSEKPIIEKTQSSDRIKMTEPVLSIQ